MRIPVSKVRRVERGSETIATGVLIFGESFLALGGVGGSSGRRSSRGRRRHGGEREERERACEM